MTLQPGTRLGPYEVVGPIGAGGMGEVYKGRDTRLNRDVALKILPDAFAADADRVARFAREAQTLAALNHANIAQIYGLEGRALVMEFVDGEDLSQRLARGALPLDEALPMARQIAEALEAAHQQGIIHRDLKPANIKLKADQHVKVLDFGLAKAMMGGDSSVGLGFSPAELAHSPTFTSPAMTQLGVILGTAAYMAPEQARGRAVDRRADIWAFGCVLYEMLTARPAFGGDSVTDVLAAIVKEDPDWNALPADVPPSIRRLLRRCLQRDARQRLHDIGDARLEIEEAIAAPPVAETQAATPSASNRRLLATIGVLALALVAVGGYAAWATSRPAAAPAVIRFRVASPPGLDPVTGWPAAVLSHDGSMLALTVGDGPDAQIYLRALDAMDLKPLEGTKQGFNAFFSPDGKWVAFTADQKLKRVPIGGGQAHVIADGIEWGGGTWGPDDVIVYTPNYTSGLWKVAATGGKAEKLTDPKPESGELGHWWPQFLPGGKHILFTSFSTPVEKSRLVLHTVATGEQRVLVEGATFGRVLTSGHLLYAREHGIVAAPIDLERLQVTGAEQPVLDGIAVYFTNGIAQISVAANGTLAFIPANEAWANAELAWVDGKGQVTQAIPPRWRVSDMKLSPDEQRVALTIDDGDRDVWTYDFQRGVRGRVTSGNASDFEPRWTTDGRRIIYASERPVFQIFIKPAAMTAPEEPLVQENFDAEPQAVTRDGLSFVYTLSDPATRSDIWMRSIAPGGKPVKVIGTKYAEEAAALSPDGKWIAYTSDETGRSEIYVQAFPQATDRWQVTTDGGFSPRWGADSRQLFYGAVAPERIVRAAVSAAPNGGLQFGNPSTVYQGAATSYDVARDGRVLILRRDPAAPAATVHVVINWFEELKKKVAGSR